MPPKPHRIMVERVSGYVAEAGAFVRRRRENRRPYARIGFADGRAVEHEPGTPAGDRIQSAADELIELAER